MVEKETAVTEAAAPAEDTAGEPTASGTGSASTASPAKRSRHVGRKVLLGAVILVAVLAAAFLFWGLRPNSAEHYDEGIDYDLRERNTLAYGALGSLGISDPVVAMRLDGAVVSYDLLRSPANDEWVDIEGDEVAPDDLQRGVIGALAEVAPEVSSLTVEQTEGGIVHQTWTVQMADVLAFFEGTLTFEEFEGRITKTVA